MLPVHCTLAMLLGPSGERESIILIPVLYHHCYAIVMLPAKQSNTVNDVLIPGDVLGRWSQLIDAVL